MSAATTPKLARAERLGENPMQHARRLVRENHANGLHPDYREYCPDCRFERDTGDSRR